MTTPDLSAILAIDLGKTSCRARLSRGGETLAEARGAGAPGLADHDGAARSFRAIADVLDQFDAELRGMIACIGIGAAGVEAGGDATSELIALLREITPARVAVINDALAAHAGAFAGEPGAVLIAGTGAIVFVVTAEGAIMQIDGWGPWLGDDGSGQWIGRHGLQAVLRAHDGRGPVTALTSDAAALAGQIERLPQWVSETGAPARQLGTFAPTVLARAEEGDAVAVEIVAEAGRKVAETCAASGTVTVCVTGGLTEHEYFAATIRRSLDAVGMRAVAARGDALDGSALIAQRTDLPYEERIIRGH